MAMRTSGPARHLDGVEVIRRIRREATTPIIILSARGDERDKIAGLEVVADGYLTKPFATDELNARIRRDGC